MPSPAPPVPDWGFPAGFGVPVYGRDATGLAPPDRWPERPSGLRTIGELEDVKLRPRNLLTPAALLVRRGPEESRHSCEPLYDAEDTRPKLNLPSDEDVTADYNETVGWARDVLRDPRAAVLTINTVGSFREAARDLHLRPRVCEIAVMSMAGRLVVDTPVNPRWDRYSGRKLSSQGLTRDVLENAKPFREVFFRDVLPALSGRRVICLDRAATYGTLFCDLESAEGPPLPAGTLDARHGPILDALGRMHWECLRLRASLHQRIWDAHRRRPLVADVRTLLGAAPSPLSAANKARAAIGVLRQIARGPVGRLAKPVLHNRAGYARTLVNRPVRDPVMRARVIERSKGDTGQARCENPRCKDTGYLEDVTLRGEPLLEVDHIIGFAEYGIDDITNMIALCSNCHARKARGSRREELAELLAEHVANLYRHSPRSD